MAEKSPKTKLPMFAHVRLLNGCEKLFTYTIPAGWQTIPTVGTIVTVPFQRRTEKAILVDLFAERPKNEIFVVKDMLSQEPFPADPIHQPFIEKLAEHYAVDSLTFYQRLRNFLKSKPEETAPLSTDEKAVPCIDLTPEQENTLNAIIPDLDQGIFQPTLIHGVTGSGKTEIYKKLFMHAHAQKKSALLLAPEVSLAVQFSAILRKSLPSSIPVFSMHSATSQTEKKQLWNALCAGTTVIIVGVHQPLFLPIPRLGIIVVDEEHEVGYQEKKHPKINTKEAALLRAKEGNFPIVLGSATPSLSSWWCTENKQWRRCTLSQRFAGKFPTIKLVNLRNEGRRSFFWLSAALEQAIEQTLKKKEQIILFLNRRGFCFFVQCAQCGFIFSCKNCSVSLTLHDDHSLRCHYCNHKEEEPKSCPTCGPKAKLLKKGVGTQQVVSLLNKRFPHARVARADLDATINKKRWSETVTQFKEGAIDILVGTQTITKGYHFPGVTLVGILWADINLSIPFYNATEMTIQQLVQVAGRAGRQSPESLVIVQTFVNHRSFIFLNEQKFPQFLEQELEYRKILNYPPCSRFAEIELRHTDESILDQDAHTCVDLLNKNFEGTITILGPTQPPVHKIKNIFSRKIYLKASSYQKLRAAYADACEIKLSSRLFFTPNPLQ